ncbi:MAG: TetR/AcrR family transcriptional regulator [archaeon]|nr:TetR/AcrR family transcriptional regulator [archaeon]
MPPETRYTREDVVSAALKIASEKGMDSITAREVARTMGCSTRPIFSYFDTMDLLKEEVIGRIKALRREYIDRGLSSEVPFKGYGRAIVRFSMDHPVLFRQFFLYDGVDGDVRSVFDEDGDRDRVVGAILRTFKVDEAQAEELFRRLSVIFYGVQTMCAMGMLKMDDGELERLLSDECYGALTVILKGNNIKEMVR